MVFEGTFEQESFSGTLILSVEKKMSGILVKMPIGDGKQFDFEHGGKYYTFDGTNVSELQPVKPGFDITIKDGIITASSGFLINNKLFG